MESVFRLDIVCRSAKSVGTMTKQNRTHGVVHIGEKTLAALNELVGIATVPTTRAGMVRTLIYRELASERVRVAEEQNRTSMARRREVLAKKAEGVVAKSGNLRVETSAGRTDPWDPALGEKPRGYALRCDCRHWRFITSKACPACGATDGYEQRDVSNAWWEGMLAGLTDEAELPGEPSDGPWLPEAGDPSTVAVRCEQCERWRLDLMAQCPGCGGGRETPASEYRVSLPWREEIERGGVVVG